MGAPGRSRNRTENNIGGGRCFSPTSRVTPVTSASLNQNGKKHVHTYTHKVTDY